MLDPRERRRLEGLAYSASGGGGTFSRVVEAALRPYWRAAAAVRRA